MKIPKSLLVEPDRNHVYGCFAVAISVFAFAYSSNFGQVLTVWDQLFGTALYGEPVHRCGIGDPTVDADNGRGVIAMQLYTLRRFWGAFTRLDGWKPQEVSFDASYRPVPVNRRDPHAARGAAPFPSPN